MRRLFALALALMVTGCSSEVQPDTTTTPLGQTTVAPAVTTSLAAPSATTSTATVSVPTKFRVVGGVDLVVIGDSFSRAGWPRMLADLVAEDLDVEVRMRNLSQVGNPEYGRLLEAGVEVLAGAEIVVVQPDVGAPLDATERKYLDGTCGGTDGEDCLRAAIAEFAEEWDTFLDELALIVPPEAILRSLTVATWTYEGFFGAEFLDDPAFPVLQGYLIQANEVASEAAREHGFVIVDINRAFNGDDYSQSAPPEWLASDGLHLSEVGSMVTAELIRGVGYQD